MRPHHNNKPAGAVSSIGSSFATVAAVPGSVKKPSRAAVLANRHLSFLSGRFSKAFPVPSDVVAGTFMSVRACLALVTSNHSKLFCFFYVTWDVA